MKDKKTSGLVPFSRSNNRNYDSDGTKALHEQSKRRFVEQYGTFIYERNLWQRVAIISLCVNALAVAVIGFIGVQPKVVPYVVEVDKMGATNAVRRADTRMTPNEASIKSQLARWVENARSVYIEKAAEKSAVNAAFYATNQRGPAGAMLSEYFQKNEPFERAKDGVVGVHVESVQPISDKTWRIEWNEEYRDRNGQLTGSTEQQATVTILINPPTDEETIMKNPLGIYVDSFSWSQRL